MAIGYLSRRSTFSASHRLHSKELSAAENSKLFGKCNHESGHGHNYELEVILRGPIDERTGLIYDLTALKEVIEREVLVDLDHKNLNIDVSEFRNLNPTAENIAAIIWNWLEPHFPKCMLYEIRLRETENNVAIFRGER